MNRGWAALLLVVLACAPASSVPDGGPGGGKADGWARDPEPLNQAAGDWIVYELQARSANACNPATAGSACAAAPAPAFQYWGEGCALLPELQAIRKSTLDDLLVTHEEPHRSAGLTLQYVDEVVGANAVWMMPLFPHNFRYALPHPCDDLGSPYAVRDYYHARGSLSERCIAEGRDEFSDPPCFANDALDALLTSAHGRGMKVMLDLAFNHLGHEYLYYDYADALPVRELLEQGADLWDFEATFDPALVAPEILDTPAELPGGWRTALQALCGEAVPEGQEAVRRWLMLREGFDHERAAMDCSRPGSLEWQLPGFYLGRDAASPSTGVGDNFTNNWLDVKFLFNNEASVDHQWEFARTRELAFRVINYWLSRGVDGFRLDHANGLTENEWRYVFRKARFYQALRGGPVPVFLSESFHEIEALNRVFDVLTEGYHHDITHGRRWATDLEYLLFENREQYLGNLSFVLLNLETHDEGRLLQSTTGFDLWRGTTFYALAAASRGTLMLQGGQEWGEPWDLGFRRSDYLRGRFPGEANWNPQGDAVTGVYRAIHAARMDPRNSALRRGRTFFLRRPDGQPEQQLLAMVRSLPDCTNTLFTFFRLWVDDVASTFAVDEDLAGRICLEPDARYRLVDVFTGEDVWGQAHPGGRTGRDLRSRGVHVSLDLGTPFQWLRLERL